MLFAGKAVIIKIAYRYGVDPATLIGLRMAYAAPLFALAAWWVDGPGGPGQRARASRARAPASAPETVWRRGDGWRITGLGLAGYYLASYLDFLGLQYVSVGLERVILYLNPTFVLLISLFWFKRRISGRQWLALAVSYAGVVLVFVHDVRTSGDGIVVGGLLVLASGLLYAVYLSAAGEMVSRLGSMRLTAWASLVSSAACVLHALVATGPAMWQSRWEVQLLSILNAVVCTVLPLFMVMAAIERLGSALASQTGMIGPASTIILGSVLLGEPVGWLQLVGTAVVIAGVLMLTRVRSSAGPRGR